MVSDDNSCYKKFCISHCCPTFLMINNENVDSYHQFLQKIDGIFHVLYKSETIELTFIKICSNNFLCRYYSFSDDDIILTLYYNIMTYMIIIEVKILLSSFYIVNVLQLYNYLHIIYYIIC